MALRDLIPFGNGSREMSFQRNEANPFFALHSEMNRLFDNAFRAFDIAPFKSNGLGSRTAASMVAIAPARITGRMDRCRGTPARRLFGP